MVKTKLRGILKRYVTAIYLLLPLFTYYERRRRYLTIIAAIYLLLPLFTYYESRHRYLTILRGVAAICLLWRYLTSLRSICRYMAFIPKKKSLTLRAEKRSV